MERVQQFTGTLSDIYNYNLSQQKANRFHVKLATDVEWLDIADVVSHVLAIVNSSVIGFKYLREISFSNPDNVNAVEYPNW